MKALVYKNYGPPEKVLHLMEVPDPEPKSNEVLVKIRATAINDYDWAMVRGKPYPYRLLFGLFKPKHLIPGMEIAGVVEKVGRDVLHFKPGDEVYGDISAFGFGGLASHVCVNEKAIIHKPVLMRFEDAASISHAAMLAYQGLVDIGEINKGEKILINGAGGGMGSFAVQIAKEYDANVTGVDSAIKLDLMRSLGYDKVMDYKTVDFTKQGDKYDIILDAKTNRSPFAFTKALKPGGRYVTVGGDIPNLLQLLIFKRFIKQKMSILSLKPNEGLEVINALFEANKLKFAIDGPYSLNEGPKLINFFGKAAHKGKIIISIPA